MNKSLEKEIDCLIAAKNNLFTVTLATFGGSFGLIFVDINPIFKWVVITFGFTISALFLDRYFKKDDIIERILKSLQKKGD